MSYTIIIPARYASTRLPGKPLRVLNGKPIIQHVYECACKTSANQIIIATDDARIEQAARSFDADVCMTASHHQSGTERIAEVLDKRNIPQDVIIVNLQGDEPLMPASCLEQVADLLKQNTQADVATLSTTIDSVTELFNSNVVKVVCDKNGNALYFSRAPVPWQRGEFEKQQAQLDIDFHWQRHIGLYAYRASYIKEYIRLSPSPIEQLESLEQLRVLWHGGRIAVGEAVEIPGPGIDTPEDLEQAAKLLVASRS